MFVIAQKKAHACLTQEDSILSIYLRKFDILPRRTNSPNSCQEKIITNYIPIFLKIKDYLRLLSVLVTYFHSDHITLNILEGQSVNRCYSQFRVSNLLHKYYYRVRNRLCHLPSVKYGSVSF